MTAIAWATLAGKIEVMNILRGFKADFNCRDSDGKCLLHYAAVSGNMPVTTMILENSTLPLNSKSSMGYTPLFYAVLNDHHDLFTTLVINLYFFFLNFCHELFFYLFSF